MDPHAPQTDFLDTAAPSPPEASDVSRQLQIVRDDMAKLTSQVSSIAADKARALASDVSHRVEGAAHSARALRGELEREVGQYPLAALGIAAGVGYLLGRMSHR